MSPQPFLDQARHNQRLHDELCAQFPDEFFDWKITLLFYIAIHLVKAMAAKMSIDLGNNHYEINRNIRPYRPGSSYFPEMPLGPAAKLYFKLYHTSQNARYDGIVDPATFETLKRADYTYCLTQFNNFKLYMRGNGVTI